MVKQKKFGIIYKATNVINDKCYVGKTINSFQLRINSHRSESANNRYDSAFHRALRKYGFEIFKWEQLCVCYSIEDLDKMECYFIKMCRSHTTEYGYNMTWGGDGQVKGYVPTKDTRKKLSDKSKKLWQNESHRKMVSIKHKKRWEAKREELSKSMKIWANKPEVKLKTSINAKKMWKNNGHRENMRKKLNKTWLIVSDYGEKFVIGDLTTWCKKQGINRSTFYGYKNKNKSWKGYFLRSMEK